jgi:hypothetical protein
MDSILNGIGMISQSAIRMIITTGLFGLAIERKIINA